MPQGIGHIARIAQDIFQGFPVPVYPVNDMLQGGNGLGHRSDHGFQPGWLFSRSHQGLQGPDQPGKPFSGDLGPHAGQVSESVPDRVGAAGCNRFILLPALIRKAAVESGKLLHQFLPFLVGDPQNVSMALDLLLELL